MEVEKLKPKKQLKKGKLKKTMKNIICRPDFVFWPLVVADEGETLIEALNIVKIDIPNFKKPLWSEISQIRKDLRPKPPPIPTVEGLLFGMTVCRKAIETNECSGVLIEAAVNPKTIVQPLIESCIDKSIPVLCLEELRNITKENFGISTSVLGVKQHCLGDIQQKIINIYKSHNPPVSKKSPKVHIDNANLNVEEMADDKPESLLCPYLYRTDENLRVFNPALETADLVKGAEQSFIKVSPVTTSQIMDSEYRKIIVKKVASNPNRRKAAQASSND